MLEYTKDVDYKSEFIGECRKFIKILKNPSLKFGTLNNYALNKIADRIPNIVLGLMYNPEFADNVKLLNELFRVYLLITSHHETYYSNLKHAYESSTYSFEEEIYHFKYNLTTYDGIKKKFNPGLLKPIFNTTYSREYEKNIIEQTYPLRLFIRAYALIEDMPNILQYFAYMVHINCVSNEYWCRKFFKEVKKQNLEYFPFLLDRITPTFELVGMKEVCEALKWARSLNSSSSTNASKDLISALKEFYCATDYYHYDYGFNKFEDEEYDDTPYSIVSGKMYDASIDPNNEILNDDDSNYDDEDYNDSSKETYYYDDVDYNADDENETKDTSNEKEEL
ncbi:hypothetical protein TVAG_411920 [Trichomonas vaginalis G3]|uniref:Uncharacterized protein n=1 Tax=Trichomonas vaginalis (strain ATCC PRA-98 / G3) TaxID=412133 RepID=A2FBA0_TRIV3|nr:hypothetical protein TVAGG3_0995720 [Trichomonas vaginalis G3]EAX97830.1 hypothetical protein TVAG_411920 [Trichomonas vaginalis G3]KAI5490370.1 hypothetical protein TVAGG3_0995720 [Trichomonas vaginalis G3]|eukprot:XP_001310760.1 hypothetical protein [Trichomonas vaginalis G3]